MKKGFTLAEILITLTIIGVVAALTIPTLVANYQKRALVVQLQKTYATIANAAKMVMADEQVDNLNNTYLREPYGYNGSTELEIWENSVGRFLKTYFKVVKTCNSWDDNINECISENYVNRNGENGEGIGGYCGVLVSGAVICMNPFRSRIDSPLTFYVDINGKAGPNMWSRDAFAFDMNYRGEIAESFGYIDWIKDPDRCLEEDQSYNAGCLSKIIQDGWKMDY